MIRTTRVASVSANLRSPDTWSLFFVVRSSGQRRRAGHLSVVECHRNVKRIPSWRQSSTTLHPAVNDHQRPPQVCVNPTRWLLGCHVSHPEICARTSVCFYKDSRDNASQHELSCAEHSRLGKQLIWSSYGPHWQVIYTRGSGSGRDHAKKDTRDVKWWSNYHDKWNLDKQIIIMIKRREDRPDDSRQVHPFDFSIL